MVNSTRLSKMNIDEVTPFDKAQETYDAVRSKLDEAGLQEVKIWDKDWKPGADFYVDDKAIRFDGDFGEVLDIIERWKT